MECELEQGQEFVLPVRLYLHFILTMSLEEYQTKSFGMNLLLHAIYKFCTTKRLFKHF